MIRQDGYTHAMQRCGCTWCQQALHMQWEQDKGANAHLTGVENVLAYPAINAHGKLMRATATTGRTIPKQGSGLREKEPK